MNSKYVSRKFQLAVFFACSTTVALYFELMDDGTYVAAISAIMGFYGAANVMSKGKEHDTTKTD